MTAKTTKQCGLFVPDPDVPPDHTGRRACAVCHLVGRPGDAHHALPVVPEQAEVRGRYEHEEERGE